MDAVSSRIGAAARLWVNAMFVYQAIIGLPTVKLAHSPRAMQARMIAVAGILPTALKIQTLARLDMIAD